MARPGPALSENSNEDNENDNDNDKGKPTRGISRGYGMGEAIEMRGGGACNDKLKRAYRPTSSEDVDLLRPLALLYHSGDCGSGLSYSASLRKKVLSRALELLEPRGWDRVRIRRWFNNEGKKQVDLARMGNEVKEKVQSGPAPRTFESPEGVGAAWEGVHEQGEGVGEEFQNCESEWWSSLYDPIGAYGSW